MNMWLEIIATIAVVVLGCIVVVIGVMAGIVWISLKVVAWTHEVVTQEKRREVSESSERIR